MRDDAELVACSRKRDAEAFGELVERHQRLVFGVALARCQDPALAEDVAQEAFVVAWRDLDRLHETDRVGTWVAGIARNLAATAARARARRGEAPIAAALEPPPVPTPQDEALEREDRELLGRALADIPAAFREVLVLYYLESESVAYIASALDISEDLVKQRLSRGRRALRDSIATRVETALSRTKIRPAFRAGVLAACAAAGARDASAAAAATGKAFALMTTTKLAILATTVAIAGGGIWLATRAHADEPAPRAATATTAATASAPATTPAAPPAPRVRKLASATERTSLLAAIREHHASAATATPASAPAPTTARTPPTLPGGDLDREYIRSAVHELIPLITECYEHGLARDPKLAGKVVVNFTIEGEPGVGGVIGDSSIDAERSTLADPEVSECIQQTMYALEIDPPAAGGTVSVTYPFEFHAAP